MLSCREGVISAHHNYLIDSGLTPGFVIGDPGSVDDFLFLADLVLPGESTPRISARVFDSGGRPLVTLKWNRITENPGGCVKRTVPDGFSLAYGSGEPLMEIHTRKFPNGYLTRIQAGLYDHCGNLRMEVSYRGAKIHGGAILTLDTPHPLV